MIKCIYMKLKNIGILSIGAIAAVGMPIVAISCSSGATTGTGRDGGTNPGALDPNYDPSNVASVRSALNNDSSLINAVKSTYYITEQPFGTPSGADHYWLTEYDKLLTRALPTITEFGDYHDSNFFSFQRFDTQPGFDEVLNSLDLKDYLFLDPIPDRGHNIQNITTMWGKTNLNSALFDPQHIYQDANLKAANANFVFRNNRWQVRYQLLPFTKYSADGKYLFNAGLPFRHSITDARRAELRRTDVPRNSAYGIFHTSPDYDQFTLTDVDKYLPLATLFGATNPIYYFIDPEFPLYDPSIKTDEATLREIWAREGLVDQNKNDASIEIYKSKYQVNLDLYENTWNYVDLDSLDETTPLGAAWKAAKVTYGI